MSGPDSVAHISENDATPFLSLSALRAGHRDLLQQRRGDNQTDAFYADVHTFIARGRAAGAYLEEDE
ncbi:MAG: hypothetical protein KC443_14100, partial [Anaerolineales bacterium]|nr:hypothetical protein [Anaerolineales bacterium]